MKRFLNNNFKLIQYILLASIVINYILEDILKDNYYNLFATLSGVAFLLNEMYNVKDNI